MAANPMSQFDVYRIGPEIKVGAFDISFTNASLFMFISASIIILFLFAMLMNQPIFHQLFILQDSNQLENQLINL